MPIVELSLSETMYKTLRQAAERSNQPLAEMVEIALEAFLQPPTSLEPGAGNGSATPADDWRRTKIHAEAEAWRSLPATVQRSYGEDFVAVHNRQVVDHHRDRLTLYRRVRARFGDVPILITPANAASPREFRIISPRVERPQ